MLKRHRNEEGGWFYEAMLIVLRRAIVHGLHPRILSFLYSDITHFKNAKLPLDKSMETSEHLGTPMPKETMKPQVKAMNNS